MKNLLTTPVTDGSLRPSQNRLMSKVCSITGSKPSRGSVIHRRGMAKKKGGVGRHVTKNVPRTFSPNLARATDLGGGVEEIRSRQSDGARLEDDQQERRLRDPEKSRPDRGLIRGGDFFARCSAIRSGRFLRAPLFPPPAQFLRLTVGDVVSIAEHDRSGTRLVWHDWRLGAPIRSGGTGLFGRLCPGQVERTVVEFDHVSFADQPVQIGSDRQFPLLHRLRFRRSRQAAISPAIVCD